MIHVKESDVSNHDSAIVKEEGGEVDEKKNANRKKKKKKKVQKGKKGGNYVEDRNILSLRLDTIQSLTISPKPLTVKKMIDVATARRKSEASSSRRGDLHACSEATTLLICS